MANNIGLQLLALLFASSGLLAAPGDENWDVPFSGGWAGGEVRSLAVQSNQLYAAGQFTTADNKLASQVARWDGTNWHPMGTLSSEMVTRAVATNSTGLFVGYAGGLAKWNGTDWSSIFKFGFMVEDVTCLYGNGLDLYVGGLMFTNISTVQLAKWDGSSWTTLMSGGGYVGAITMKGAELYAGGSFGSALGGGSMSYVARRFVGGGGWSSLGTGVNGDVLALTVAGNDVYAGGSFTTAGGLSANGIAKWNGTNWFALGSGVNGSVSAISAVGSNIYVGGKFSTAGGVACTNLACWNGTAWTAVNAQMRGVPKALIANGTTLYVGGAIDSVNNQKVGNIFSYSAGAVQPLKAGVSYGNVTVARTNGNNIFVGGQWNSIYGTNTASIARYDGTNWHGLGTGLTNAFGVPLVRDIIIRSNEVFVCGRFDSAGGIAATNIAKWNGSAWQKLGNGLTNTGNATIHCLAFFGNDLYAGGDFSSSYRVAKWNGTTWSNGSAFNNSVNSLVVFNNELYAGGSFSSPFNALAKWNGSVWSSVGSSQLNNSVHSMAVLGNYLYVSGFFTAIGSTNYSYIAKWSGGSWSAVGTGLNGPADRLHAVGNDLYVGGDFTTAGGVSVNGVARWDGTNWHSLGGGLATGAAKTFLPLANEVLVGGSFFGVGTNAAGYLASWRLLPMKLQTQRTGNNLALSWPITLSKMTLQSASDVSSLNWSNAVHTPVPVNNFNTLITNMSGGGRFFRLKKN